jgi:hypothetical protein
VSAVDLTAVEWFALVATLLVALAMLVAAMWPRRQQPPEEPLRMPPDMFVTRYPARDRRGDLDAEP